MDIDDTSAIAQLKSYLSLCINARYGVVASHRWFVIEKGTSGERRVFNPLRALIDAQGTFLVIDYKPGQPVKNDVQAYNAHVSYSETTEEEDINEFYDKTRDEPRYKGTRASTYTIRSIGVASVLCILSILIAHSIGSLNATNRRSASRVSVTSFPVQADRVFTITPQAVNTSNPTSLSSRLSYATDVTVEPTSTFILTTMPTMTATKTISPTFEPTATVDATLTPTIIPSATIRIPALDLFSVLTISPSFEIPAAAPSSSPTYESSSTPPNEPFGIIQASQNANVRNNANSNAIVIAVIASGTRVEIIRESEDGSFIQIRLKSGMEGWIASFLVRMEQPTEP